MSPEAGLATAAQLKPHRALESMTSVGSAADRTVGDEHKNLAAAPPGMQRPAGAPQTLSGDPKTDAPVQYSQDPAKRSQAPGQEKAEVTGAREPEGPIEAEKEEGPSGWDTFKMALGFGLGWVASKLGFEVDPTELAAKFAGLPTKDEALKQAMAGNAPGVNASGAAEQTSGEQGTAVDAKGQDTVTAGRDDASRGMGEDQVYPDVPPEQMQGNVPARSGGAPVAAGTAPNGVVPAEAAAKVAEHDNGPRLQATFQQGQQGMSQGRQAKDQGFRESQSRHRSKVDTEVTINTRSQKQERDNALGDVDAQRAVWRRDQDTELSKLGTKKSDRQVKARKDVTDREKQADDDVEKEKTGSDKKIQDEAGKAEREANQKRDTAVQDSGNWVTKAFDWIKNKVIEIKNAIVRVIREARDAVVNFIKNFKETVERWINEARTFIVEAIKNLINDLIEFAKAMVRAIIELATKIRNLITNLIRAAIDLVDRLAAQLKQIIKDLLDRLSQLLGDLLKILFQALMDVIKATIEAVKQYLAMASQLLGMLGTFLFVAIDFLSDPGGWLSGAKNSAVDGAKNHLFREVKAAVKQWFQSKIEEVLGVGKAVIDTLVKGGFTLEKIVKETWDAIVPMLPFIIGEIVITKVIAKLIPGAGWVMAVIDAIQVAIGALAEILRAMGAVLAWLISVRQGGAGVLFAKAVAAGIVALLELAYEALLSGIGKYVAKVGKRLKGVAAKMLKGKNRDAPGQSPGRDGEPAPDTRRPGDETPQAAPRPVGAGAPGTTPRPRPVEFPGTRPVTGPRPRPAAGPDPRPTVKPRPSGPSNTRPGQGPTVPDRPKGRPDTTPAGGRPGGPQPSVPRPTPATAPGKPVPASSKDKDGRPKTAEDDRPDTRPKPSSKPKPKAEAPPRPKDPPRTTPKDEDPSAPKPRNGGDERVPGGSKHDDGSGPTSKRDGDDNAPGKPNDPRKPDDRGDAGPSRKTPPDRDAEDKKDQQKKREDDSKEKRLREIVARIRPRIEKWLDHGILEQNHIQYLAQLRAWYRLTRLFKRGSESFSVRAVINPEMEAADGFTERSVPTDRNKRLQFPNADPRTRFKDGLPKSFIHQFINPTWARGGQEPYKGEERAKNIPGFAWIYGGGPGGTSLQNKRGNFIYDAMHLLPMGLGGPRAGSNMVPAQNYINDAFDKTFEVHAVKAFGLGSKSKVPGQYEVILQLYEGANTSYPNDVYPRGFPESLTARWSKYRYKGEGTGRSREDWVAEEWDDAKTITFPPPPLATQPPINVNTETSITNLKNVLGRTSDEIAFAVIDLRRQQRGGPFTSLGDLQERLLAYQVPGKQGRHKRIKKIDEYVRRMNGNYGRTFVI